MIKYDHPATITALEAKSAAQRLAFAPVAFQAASSLVRLGILDCVASAGVEGLSAPDVSTRLGLSVYGVAVLLDMGLAIGAVWRRGDRYVIDKIGLFLVDDQLTRVNMDFVHDVCYRPMADLQASIEQGRPVGLGVFGACSTIYPALQSLPAPARESWHAFDHFYSTTAFSAAFERVRAEKPIHLFDVGGNTGKWAIYCTTNDPDIHVTILDLPEQLAIAAHNVATQGLSDRISFHPIDVLDEASSFPGGADVIWMSQFLDCFSEAEICSIVRRASVAMTPEASLFIMETFWDRQRHEAAAYSLHATSLYFTCIANGNSRMYEGARMEALLHDAGLQIVSQTDHLGLGHTLMQCRIPESRNL